MLRIALLFTIFCSAQEGLAQEDYITSRWNFKLGYSRFGIHSGYNNSHGMLLDFKDGSLQTKKIGQIFLEAHHRVTPALEIGTYLGYGKFQIYPDPDTLNYRYDYTRTPFYGISANFHLLPLLIKQGNPRLDLYLGERFGGYYQFTHEDFTPERGHYLDFGIHAGINYYFGKHFGISGEYGVANGRTVKNGQLKGNYRTFFRAGFAVKF